MPNPREKIVVVLMKCRKCNTKWDEWFSVPANMDRERAHKFWENLMNKRRFCYPGCLTTSMMDNVPQDALKLFDTVFSSH